MKSPKHNSKNGTRAMTRGGRLLAFSARGGLISLFLFAGCKEPSLKDEKQPSAGDTATTEGEFYIVKQGDTLYSIAKTHYGDGSLWPDVQKANADAFAETDQLSVGQPLLLPPRDALVKNAPASGASEAVSVELPSEHTVRAGDTLYAIALRHYGDGEDRFIKAIVDANRDSVGDVHELSIGEVLHIPELQDEGATREDAGYVSDPSEASSAASQATENQGELD